MAAKINWHRHELHHCHPMYSRVQSVLRFSIALGPIQSVAICYVLPVPVLWVTSHLRIMGGMSICLQRVVSLRRRAQADAATVS